MFNKLKEISSRPALFEFYTADELWTNAHTANQMLQYHLNAFNQKAESATYEKNQLNGFWSPDDYYAFVNCFKYETEKVTLDKYTIIEAGGARTVYNWSQHFSPSMLKHEFTESSLKVEALFSDVAGQSFNPESNEMAIVARNSNL